MSEIKHFVPWISFVAGVGGGIHCAGMCGGLVTASCQNSNDIFRYQMGRLLGYLFLILVLSAMGSIFQFKFISPYFSYLPSLFIGMLFFYWGLQNFRGKKAELPLPRFLSSLYQVLWRNLVAVNKGMSKSFFTGLISIFLPCGLLYGVILAAVAMQDWLSATTSIFFFWMGTLPSMVLAPSIFHKIIRPLQRNRPKVSAIILMLIGIMTVGMRFYRLDTQLESSTTTTRATSDASPAPMTCH